ncbi:apolipoprotein N-acyltransferase [Pseudoclavibacter sp. Z016]|uniref:apolipoprotein N-acyltransferase n=1 Tax=Pseudoclavibacter sp. Z016 TaxID=2080581 RepID=UPI000CE90340|nr:apolipoprotein N-acyltransferase [Pseudoclavibacter sp. Z016]PPF75756.1 apolipoprotein N-acyltransferase [Pseudoclavibacter sp. Z016]
MRSFWLSLLAAVAGGLLLRAAFPGPALWPLAFVGIGLVLCSLVHRSAGGAFLVGLASGLAYYFPLIAWASLFLGPVPWSALSVLSSLFWAGGAVLIALAYRRLTARWESGARRVIFVAAAIAGLWTLREAIYSAWPYGGFAWGRIAQSQSASPFAELVSWLGLSGMGFVMVFLVALTLELGRARVRPQTWVTAAAAVLVVAVVPIYPTNEIGSARIAAVQGDTPEAAYFVDGDPGDVFLGHVDATLTIPDDADVDAILWPEGSIDLDPKTSTGVRRTLDQLSEQYGAPIVANAVTVEEGVTADDDRFFNSQFVWDAESGWGDQYDKKHPIPFGEYVPDREFWYSLAPDLIGLIGRGYSPGERDSILEVGDIRAGTYICYDIVDDVLIRDAVLEGATVLFAPSNNADFGKTDEPAQQLAFARLRSMETGRSIVQASTVGLSAVYSPEGRVLAELPWYEPGVMIVDVPLADGLTPAVLFGRGIEVTLAALGLGLLIGAGSSKTRRMNTATVRIPRR